MEKLLDIQKANLFKEAFALAIKKQQDLIVEKENAIQFGFSPISGGTLTAHDKKKLTTGINNSRQYINFYTDMYLYAEESRITISDKRLEQFAAVYHKRYEQFAATYKESKSNKKGEV